MLGVAVTISSGTWIVGVPQFVRHSLHGGAGRFSLLVVAYALGSIGAGAFLARRPIRRKARGALFAWCAYLPAYTLLALAHSLGPAFAGALIAGAGQGSAYVLTVSAAQTEIPDSHLGRVTGLISLVHRGAHATGLLLRLSAVRGGGRAQRVRWRGARDPAGRAARSGACRASG